MQPCCVGFLFACDLPFFIELSKLAFFNTLNNLPACGLNHCHKITYQHRTSAFLHVSLPIFLLPQTTTTKRSNHSSSLFAQPITPLRNSVRTG
jgi:hypothetical protein